MELNLVAIGHDKDGNTIKIPIVFSHVWHVSGAKMLITQKIGQARGITI